MTFFKIIYPSPIGDLSLVADAEGLLGVWFVGQTYFERGLSGQPKMELSPILEQACDWLNRYFAGQEPGLDNLPLSAQGTDFQKRVWAELAKIPYGQTTTYKALADKLHCKSAQAVGGAVGKNPLSILVPCHRVLGADGSLTGYAGGLDKKIWLLEHEGVSLKLGI